MSSKDYNERNREHVRDYNKKWYLKNRDKKLLQSREWQKNNQDKVLKYREKGRRKWSLKRRYSMELETFMHMVVSQGNRCAICFNEFKNDRDTCVDHDHFTGKVRQLLCFNCNIAIGKLKDSPVLVESALNYLNKWSI